MSLINEALKKAQRQRSEEPADTAAAAKPVAGERVTKRSKATSANTMVLLGSGAVVLIVLSVVVTVYLLNRPAATPATRTAAATPEPAAPAATPPAVTPAPITLAPVVVPGAPAVATNPENAAAPTTAASPASAAPATLPAAAPANANIDPAPPAPSSTATSAPSTPEAAATKPAAPPAQPDERIAAFVEAIRVTGIRSSGTESRVLMNERVFRVNDLVDRALNLRLVKVAADSLTFADANGVTYVKNF